MGPVDRRLMEAVDRTIIEELTPNQRTRIVRLASLIARDNGYCDEVTRLLRLIGFSMPKFFATDQEAANYKDPEDT